jgi:hypothetical protein
MQYPPPSKNKPSARPKNAPRSLALRIDRAAGDLNPILIVFVIGLLALNLTFYIGMSISREPAAWTQARQIDSPAPPPPGSSFSQYTEGASAAAGN